MAQSLDQRACSPKVLGSNPVKVKGGGRESILIKRPSLAMAFRLFPRPPTFSNCYAMTCDFEHRLNRRLNEGATPNSSENQLSQTMSVTVGNPTTIADDSHSR